VITWEFADDTLPSLQRKARAYGNRSGLARQFGGRRPITGNNYSIISNEKPYFSDFPGICRKKVIDLTGFFGYNTLA
jgi:hypothetical protein